MEWVSHNLPLIMIVAGVIAAWAVNNYRLKNHEIRLHDVEKEVHEHQSNTALHIDPARDHAIWAGFQNEVTRRFDGIDRKIDKLMLVQQPIPPL
jgi:hypothetical protein